MAMWWFGLICCHRFWRTSLPTTHISIHIWHLFLGTWYLWTRYLWVSVDQISMCICRPDIYGCLSTRYLWISGDQISMSICEILFLPEGKAVGNCLIVIPVLLNFPKSLLTTQIVFRPLGKAVGKLLIAIPVLSILSKSLFTIHKIVRPLGKAVANLLIAIPVLLIFRSQFLRFMEFYDLHQLLSTPIQSTSFAFPIHSTSNPHMLMTLVHGIIGIINNIIHYIIYNIIHSRI